MGLQQAISSLWAKYKRDIIVIISAALTATVLMWLSYLYFIQLPERQIKTELQQDIVTRVYTDAYWFHELYMRWTVIDWLLTLLATGTAVSAVIKNSYSQKTAATDLTNTDKVLIALAILTVIATTFDGKLHAGQLADRYRAGDLILQEAKIDYAAQKQADPKATDNLTRRWHEAQTILESTSLAGTKPPPGGDNSASGVVGTTEPKKQNPPQTVTTPPVTTSTQTNNPKPAPKPEQH